VNALESGTSHVSHLAKGEDSLSTIARPHVELNYHKSALLVPQ
jgi:hypothetical protein